ncbi:MAG: hypothetical protein LBJ41_05080 [Treponema sp.]|jgi:hypothetical protein|nr:hypothetical protein [Treponema sp.]
MIQFYFLSILCNTLAGYALTRDTDELDNTKRQAPFTLSARNLTFRLLLGLVSSVTGLFKLLSAIDLPFAGDLVPALTGIGGGVLLLYDYYANTTTLTTESTLRSFLTRKKTKKSFGVWSCAIAALHFLFPEMVFF